MKFLKVANELITDKNITSNEFRVYVYLLSLYNESKACAYPSIDTISANTNISLATVKRSIKRLVELGYMVIEKKKGISGNFNTYKGFRFLVRKIAKDIEINKKSQIDKDNRINDIKKVILSDYKECGVQIEIDELIPFTKDHQQKISLVLKQGIKLTEKQMWLLGDFEVEALKEAIRIFKKQTKTNSFAFLIDTYYTSCANHGIVPTRDIQKYCGKQYLRLSREYLNNIETENALEELEVENFYRNIGA